MFDVFVWTVIDDDNRFVSAMQDAKMALKVPLPYILVCGMLLTYWLHRPGKTRCLNIFGIQRKICT
jgi:hypothetical protein